MTKISSVNYVHFESFLTLKCCATCTSFFTTLWNIKIRRVLFELGIKIELIFRGFFIDEMKLMMLFKI